MSIGFFFQINSNNLFFAAGGALSCRTGNFQTHQSRPFKSMRSCSTRMTNTASPMIL